MTEWYYNRSTGEVEEGPQSIATERYGPFESRDDAARAPDIIAGRAKAWADEDAENDR